MKFVQETFVHKHTGIGETRPELTAAIKVDLTRHLSSVTDGLQDEIKYSMTKEMGDCEDWTPIVLYSKLARIVALLSGRVFVGLPLSRDEEWIDSTIQFTVDAVQAAEAIRKWNYLLRPLVAGFLPEIRKVKAHKKRGGQLLAPMLEKKLEQLKSEKKLSEEEEQQMVFVSWVLGHTNEKERWNPDVLGNNQMVCEYLNCTRLAGRAVLTLFSVLCRNPHYHNGCLTCNFRPRLQTRIHPTPQRRNRART